MIPLEAVEAAAKAMVRISQWEDVAEGSKMQLRADARLALEAAAPYILVGTVDGAVESILIDHQRQSSSACLCGWSKLGLSHPGHQAAMLNAAGVLK